MQVAVRLCRDKPPLKRVGAPNSQSNKRIVDSVKHVGISLQTDIRVFQVGNVQTVRVLLR